jgi:multisubunit Na+/H+ antiporter MnhB subunit
MRAARWIVVAAGVILILFGTSMFILRPQAVEARNIHFHRGCASVWEHRHATQPDLVLTPAAYRVEHAASQLCDQRRHRRAIAGFVLGGVGIVVIILASIFLREPKPTAPKPATT